MFASDMRLTQPSLEKEKMTDSVTITCREDRGLLSFGVNWNHIPSGTSIAAFSQPCLLHRAGPMATSPFSYLMQEEWVTSLSFSFFSSKNSNWLELGPMPL